MAPQEPIRKRTGGPGNGPGGGGAGGGGAGGGGARGAGGGSGIRSAQEIPDKLYFRIGEVAKLCAVPAYVLRFWEGEFPQLKPNKGGTGQRLYRRRDVEMALRVKTLLYDEGYTIAGARQAFKAELRSNRDSQMGLGGIADGGIDAKHLESLRKELRELYTMLSRPAARPAVQSIRPPRPVPVVKTQPPPTPFPRSPAMDRERAKERGLVDSLFGDD